MRSLILTAIIAVAFIFSASVQNRFSVKDRVDRLKDRLKLTDTQTAQADSIFTSASDKVKAIPDSVQDRRQEMRQIMTNANTDFGKILTDDQKVEYKKMMEERRGRMGRRRNNGN
jgi:Spy/CpxP family protein refolding chaperone